MIEIEIFGNAQNDSVTVNINNDQSDATPYEEEIHNSIVDMIEAFLKAHKRFNNAAPKKYPIVPALEPLKFPEIDKEDDAE